MNAVRMRPFAVLLASAIMSACAALYPQRPTPVPIQTLADRAPCKADTLLVLLPGAYSEPRDFIDQGFVSTLRRQDFAIDVLMADANIGYFTERSILRRLREDVVLPARAQGYAHVWLAGTSLGGFSAAGYAARHGSEIDGVLMISPYPGTRDIVREVAAAGGARQYNPVPQEDDLEREVWHWLGSRGPEDAPPVYLAYGADDRFAEGHRLMAAALPEARVRSRAGGHDWPVWRELWREFLGSGALPAARCAKDAA